MFVLVINCGSSSVKYVLFDGNEQRVLEGKEERLGPSAGERTQTHQQAIMSILDSLGDQEIDAVGHRVVHGGADYFAPQLIDCLLYTSPSPRDRTRSRMPSSA